MSDGRGAWHYRKVGKRMPGDGSIFRRKDGRWVAQVSKGPRGGRTVTTLYRRTRAEAKAALDDLRGRRGKPSTLTVGAYLARWVSDARNIRPATRQGYGSVVTFHLAPTIGHIPLVDLAPMDVERMLSEVGPALAPKSLRNVHAVLRRALTQAVRMGLVERNVASREYVDVPRVTTEEPDALTEPEIEAIFAVLSGDWIEPHVLVALGTGLRQGEQLGLAWEDVSDVLYVRKELTRQDGRYQRVEPKTDRSRRTVPLAPWVAAAFALQRDRLRSAGFVTTSTGPVFVNGQGAALSGSVLTHRWYDLLAKAGVKRRPWKILRATFSTRLWEAGVPDLTIAALMGHARTATTKRHYIRATGSGSALDVIGALGPRENKGEILTLGY